MDLSPVQASRVSSAIQTLLNVSRPSPVRLVRKPLDFDFAVTLMRTSYNVVDELDFVAMDEFQAMFFELRSREWEVYVKEHRGITQGILTDALYFDFISFAQLITIHYFMRDAQTVFEEQYADSEGTFKKRIVKRDVTRLASAWDILQAFYMRVGDILVDKYFAVRRVRQGDVEGLRSGINWVYILFEEKGFCLMTRVIRDSGDDVLFEVEMVGPCTLWGNHMLQRRRSICSDYDCWCVEAIARSGGLSVMCETRFSKSSIFRKWRLKRA